MTDPDTATEQQISDHAYQLWEQAGCPEGREEEFWQLAEAHVLGTPVAPEDEMLPPDGPMV